MTIQTPYGPVTASREFFEDAGIFDDDIDDMPNINRLKVNRQEHLPIPQMNFANPNQATRKKQKRRSNSAAESGHLPAPSFVG